jgi:uncharacterized protein (TIRG00374 family)
LKRSESIFKDFLSSTSEIQKPRSRVVFWVSILLAIVLLYLALRGLDWPAFLRSLERANYFYVALLLIWSSAIYFLRALRWRILLTSQKNIPSTDVFWANMAGYLGNSVLPARAGEIIRAAYIARKQNIPIVFVLATGITERLMDLAALVVISASTLFFFEAFPGSVRSVLQGFAVVAIIGVVLIFLLPVFQDLMSQTINSLPFLNASIKTVLSDVVNQAVQGVQAIASIERGLAFLFLTGLIWLTDGIGMAVLADSLHESLSLAQSLLFIAALGISSAIPSTPGYIGVYQFIAITVLVPFGFERESALALILISQALNLLVVACWGGVGLWIGSRSIFLKPLEKKEEEVSG